MNRRLRLVTLLTLSILSIILIPMGSNSIRAHAAGTPAIGVSYPGSTNGPHKIIDPTSPFTLVVNVSNVGSIAGFDVTVNYGSAELDALGYPTPIDPQSMTLSGGLFYQFRSGFPSNCIVLNPINKIGHAQTKYVRMVVALQGQCSVDGTDGLLFSITFNVVTAGSSSIDILQGADAGGSQKLQLVSGESGHTLIQAQVFNAYIRNKAGTPPNPDFTFNPTSVLRAQPVNFDASLSSDPDNATKPGKGIKFYVWEFGDNTDPVFGVGTINPTHIFQYSSVVFATGSFPVRLTVVDIDDGLTMSQTHIVNVANPTVHDLAVTLAAEPSRVAAGDKIAVTATVYNRGTETENAALIVTYGPQGTGSTIGQNSSFTIFSSRYITFGYKLDTTGLAAGSYTIQAVVTLNNNVVDANPVDNIITYSFTVSSTPPPALFSWQLVAGVLVALAAVGGAVGLIRRRRKDEDLLE